MSGGNPVNYVKRVRAALMSAALVCVCIRIVWWAIQPLLPVIVVGILFITALGFIISITFHRSTKL